MLLPAMRRPGPTHLTLLVLLLTTLACTREAPNSSIAPATYRTQGVVRHVSGAGRPGAAEILVHHEALPGFVDDRGEVVGMDAMTMAFPVRDPHLVEGLAAGDKIAFDFTVDWNGSPTLEVTRIEKLPADAELDFSGKARASDQARPLDGPVEPGERDRQ